MLQVALRPAAVAGRIVDDIGGHFLPAAGDVGHQPYLVAGAVHEGRLDDVVTEYFAAERRSSRQRRQRAMLGERAQPDDGVMAPVVAFPELPESQTTRKQRSVQAHGELQQPREQRFAPSQQRQRLDDADLRVGIHHLRESDQRLTRHDAVGVEHDHVAISFSPAAAKIGHVAALATEVVGAAAVEEPPAGAMARDHLPPCLLLEQRDLGPARVREHEEIEAHGLRHFGE